MFIVLGFTEESVEVIKRSLSIKDVMEYVDDSDHYMVIYSNKKAKV